MRRGLFFAMVAASLGITLARSGAELEAFEDKFGRRVEAELLSHSGEDSSTVFIRRRDGKTVNVDLSYFSRKDQQRIREWIAEHPAQSKFEALRTRTNIALGKAYAPIGESLHKQLSELSDNSAKAGDLELPERLTEACATLRTALDAGTQAPFPIALNRLPADVNDVTREKLQRIRASYRMNASAALRDLIKGYSTKLGVVERELVTSKKFEIAKQARLERQRVEIQLSQMQSFFKPPKGSVEWGRSRYYRHDQKMTWKEAVEYCEKLGGRLATIGDREEQDFLNGMSKNSFWIGGTDEKKEGEWAWISGEEFVWGEWNDGFANNWEGKDHYIQFEWDGKWNDRPATFTTRPMCEWPLPDFF